VPSDSIAGVAAPTVIRSDPKKNGPEPCQRIRAKVVIIKGALMLANALRDAD
jgi:hypothetical protein